MIKPVALAGVLDPPERPFIGIGVLVGIDVGQHELAEIDRIGAGSKGAVVVIRVLDLHAQRFPPAGGPAIEEPRPALAQTTELLLDRRHQFMGDGIAIRAKIG